MVEDDFLKSQNAWLVTDFSCCDMSSPLALMRTLVMTLVVLRRVRNCLSIIIIIGRSGGLHAKYIVNMDHLCEK